MAKEVLETKRGTDAPVLSLDADQEVDEEFVETWRERIFGPPEDEECEAQAEEEGKGADKEAERKAPDDERKG